ncbi:hypothetical protein SB725_20570 [Pseudomonas sp. SIMBA_041]|uniref:hypothetical protein n=1 Tax=Pseudomonas sp. SIMBA_041 TaxID=3085782 RepID=UPI00397ACB02
MKTSIARNHHFISQAEQRLNAIDATVKPRNQRIYNFEILQRESPRIRKIKSAGVKIESNLARMDLYALKVLEGAEQYNLEVAFQKYENDCSRITRTLLKNLKASKPESLKSELLRLYVLKLVNTIRNPYTIKRTLEMFRELRGVLPGSETLQADFISFDCASRPQVAKICSEFGVSEDEYVSWLKVIFLLIMQPLGEGLNLIESLIKNLIENTNVIKNFLIYRYDEGLEGRGVLLCDRMIDQRPLVGTQMQMFNLDATAFMVVILVDVKNQDFVSLTPEDASLDFRQGNLIHVDYAENNLEALKNFNQHCVWLANANVFCASENPFGVDVEMQIPVEESLQNRFGSNLSSVDNEAANSGL